MKLLILTQKVNQDDDVLGFFHGWIKEFATHCDSILVVCLQQGSFDLPENVKVKSLGKEKNVSKFAYIRNFYKYIWKEKNEYDTVFVHMNPEYVVLGGLLWRLMKKRVSLWYVHRQVNIKLRIASMFAHDIFTAAKESFRLKSKKLHIVGHGIDTELFRCREKKKNQDLTKIISVGRITKIKNLDTLIHAAAKLKNLTKQKFSIDIIGSPTSDEDKEYFSYLQKEIRDKKVKDVIHFVGSVSHKEIVDIYCQSDFSVNLTPTGGIDKAVLESMSCGVPALVSNRAFESILGEYAGNLLFSFQDSSDLAKKMDHLIGSSADSLSSQLRTIVSQQFDYRVLINEIVLILR